LGRERGWRELAQGEEGVEKLTVKPIELRWSNAGDRRGAVLCTKQRRKVK
jgi:hypothetical protein